MQFILTDVALGLAALLGYQTLRLLARRPAVLRSPVRLDPSPMTGARAACPEVCVPGPALAPEARRDLMVVDPRRLVRLG